LPVRPGAAAEMVRHRIASIAGVAAWALLPTVLPVHYVDLLVFSAILAIGGLGVGFLLGQAGIINLAQAGFYGIGAYASAYCIVTLHWSAWIGLAVGLAVSAVVAAAIGWPILRLNGHFLALATLALLVIFNALFLEWDWLTGGSLGISGVPKISAFGYALDSPRKFYYFVWPLTVAIFWLVANVTRGRTGLAMRAMRDSPDAARVMAVDSTVLRAKLFVLSALLGSISGTLFAHYVGYISVESFTVERTIFFLLAPVIGGLRNPWAAIPGAIFVALVPEVLSPLGDVYRVLFGLALMLIIMLFPAGLLGRWARSDGAH